MYYSAIDSRDFNKVLEKKKKQNDTAHFNMNESGFFVRTGIDKDDQFYIIDQNRNGSYDDDRLFVFPATIGDSLYLEPKLSEKFTELTMPVLSVLDSLIVKDTIHFSVVPDNFYPILDENKNVKMVKRDEPFLKVYRYDYFLGSFKINGEDYKMAINKFNGVPGYHMILVEEKSMTFKNNTDANRPVYRLKDTIELEEAFYRLDKFSSEPSAISLKKLDWHKPKYGFRKGDKIRDFNIKVLSRDSIALRSSFNGKNLLLLDFWGTWCGPCKELTPDLVHLYETQKEKVSFLGIAYQQDSLPIFEYINKNGMTWHQGFVQGKPKSGLKNSPKILRNLRVEVFPTFILLNKDLEIIFRGNGNNFHELQ